MPIFSWFLKMSVLYLPLKLLKGAANSRTAIFISVCNRLLLITDAKIYSFEYKTVLMNKKFYSNRIFRIILNKTI